ncbi:CaiB/BaiF CoA transferase family protein [Salinisphaera aquimarina]|uniref:CaiB/BaiF CoA transferase family protein n=1 Tax=Salinisphaera aquimarina TaxID=2094031 RepID=A0ABV7EN92_9GAMM
MTDNALQPYRGVRVLDLAQGLAGPYAAGMLAAMGADVIKVEPPEGDWGRLMGEARNGSSSMSLPANWGKRAICVDARSDEGKAVLHRLAEEADVIVESFRPGVLAKLGLGYERLAAERPGIIVVSISGYGQNGPHARRPGSDSIIQAVSGMASMNRDASGTPRRVGMLAVDMVTGLYAGFAMAGALFEQRASGQGRHLQISLIQAATAFQMTALLQNLMRDGQAGTPTTAPSGFFATRSGMMSVTCLRNAMFAKLCDVVGHPEWADDPRFATNNARIENIDALHAAMAVEFRERDRDDWVEQFNAVGVLCGPVNEYADLVADEQVRDMGVFTEVDTPALGVLPLAGLPGIGMTPDQQRPDPPLGGHTREVLAEAGYNESEIDALLAARVCLHDPREN